MEPDYFDGRKGKEGQIINNPLPANNEDFGSTNGTIQLTVTVGGVGVPTCENNDGGVARAEVFFEKDLRTNPGGVDPNWFYYWRQLVALDNITLPIYNVDDPQSPLMDNFPINFLYSDVGNFAWNPASPNSLYGTTNETSTFVPVDVNNPLGDRYAITFDPRITFGESCSKLCGHRLTVVRDPQGNLVDVRVNPGDGTGDTGIDCFNQVYYHEYEHLVIFRENWPLGRREGMGWDSDMDGYSDQFEMNNADAGFINGQNDSYALGAGSAGWDYEEGRCRNLEDNLPDNLFISDDDWSFDPTNTYQGKNWEE